MKNRIMKPRHIYLYKQKTSYKYNGNRNGDAMTSTHSASGSLEYHNLRFDSCKHNKCSISTII